VISVIRNIDSTYKCKISFKYEVFWGAFAHVLVDVLGLVFSTPCGNNPFACEYDISG
jgi:hypothetical protein